MKVLVAPDSYKGSLKSPEVARALAAGVRDALPDAEIVELPVGDGGEGTLEALVAATGGQFTTHQVEGPLGTPLSARLGLLGDGKTVFVEMAESAGLSRLEAASRNPFRASTFGVGQLLQAAIETGRPLVLIGIGGSATNDGGAGMLAALGVRLLDKDGKELLPGGAALASLVRMDLESFIPPRNVELVVACDVTNPLTGQHGAAAIYGPQKFPPEHPATPEQLVTLDAALAHFADVVAETLGCDLRDEPGAGAAGGLGFALLAFLGARLERGVRLVLDAVRFDEQLEGTDLVLTGEGRIDGQTTGYGKTLAGIGERARQAGVPVLALGGSVSTDLGDYRAAGLTSVASIVPGPMALEEALHRAPELARDAARRLVEVFLASHR